MKKKTIIIAKYKPFYAHRWTGIPESLYTRAGDDSASLWDVDQIDQYFKLFNELQWTRDRSPLSGHPVLGQEVPEKCQWHPVRDGGGLGGGKRAREFLRRNETVHGCPHVVLQTRGGVFDYYPEFQAERGLFFKAVKPAPYIRALAR